MIQCYQKNQGDRIISIKIYHNVKGRRITMKEIVMKVEGMVCGGCENRVKNALHLIEGVKEVEANHVEGIVKVNADEEVQINILKEKIEDLGFEVKE